MPKMLPCRFMGNILAIDDRWASFGLELVANCIVVRLFLILMGREIDRPQAQILKMRTTCGIKGNISADK